MAILDESERQAYTPPANKPREDPFLANIKKIAPPMPSGITRDPKEGSIMLGQYSISASMWRTWAAAAGLPGARWDDQAAYARVASYAARTLYEQFRNWGMVAIAWKYGPKRALMLKELYGRNPTAQIVEHAMGADGAKFMSDVQKAMAMGADNPYVPEQLPIGPGPQPPQMGNVELRFTLEEGEEQPEQGPTTSASLSLINVLSSMANQVAGGSRLAIEDTEPAVIPGTSEDVPTLTSGPQPINEEDTLG